VADWFASIIIALVVFGGVLVSDGPPWAAWGFFMVTYVVLVNRGWRR